MMMRSRIASMDQQRCFEQLRAAPGCRHVASQVRLQDTDRLDSAGMLIAEMQAASSRGMGNPRRLSRNRAKRSFPSGSAALYRRTMLDQIGGFDDEFFLILRGHGPGAARRFGRDGSVYMWPMPIVEHRYSHSAGRASALKAYLVERNRLFVAMKNFPSRMLREGDLRFD